MIVFYRRVPTGPGQPHEPRTYIRWPANPLGLLAVVVCENGHGVTLRERFQGGNHEVDSRGVVLPSIVCTVRGCSSHVFGILEGWGAS